LGYPDVIAGTQGAESMTYFGILGLFLLPPLFLLLLWVPSDIWRWILRSESPVNWEPFLYIWLNIALALIYTTPWDNYLVATDVWWYDPKLVAGLTIGWVPIEEYIFFILQTALTGLWALAVQRYILRENPVIKQSTRMRWWSSGFLATCWLVSTALLLSDWQAGTYLTLILCWALIPVLIQTAFGADILLAYWRSLLLIIWIPTLYLWLLDAMALASGSWTINPAKTIGLKLGVIPIEEMLFFLMTNVIIAFGMMLMCSPAGKKRSRVCIEWLRSKRAGVSPSND
jgi:lycopene cyclase domain-containing protein